VVADQIKISIILALPLAAIYPVAIISLLGCIAIETTSSSCKLKNFYVFLVLSITIPRAAVVKTISFYDLYLKLFLVSKLLNPWAYLIFKFAFGRSPAFGISL